MFSGTSAVKRSSHIPILISAPNGGTPLRVASIGTQIRYHDDDALTSRSARALAWRRSARRGQLVTLSASRATPGAPALIE